MKKTLILLGLCVLGFVVLGLYHAHFETHLPEKELDDFNKLIEQPDNITCGPTSCTMVLQYYGKDVTLLEVKNATKTEWFQWNGTPIGMTAPSMVKKALTDFGVPSQMRWGSTNTIKHFITNGIPVIILVRSGELTWHYVVVVGFTEKEFTIADPGSGTKYKMDVKTLEDAWGFTHDLNGTPCENQTIRKLLFTIDVYPKTMIIPRNAPN